MAEANKPAASAPQPQSQSAPPHAAAPQSNIVIPARPAAPPEPDYRGGKLTAAGIRRVIERGGSASVHGTIISRLDAVPTQEQLDEFYAKQEALLHDWDQANRSAANRGTPQPAPPGLAQPAFSGAPTQAAPAPQTEQVGVQPQQQPPR